MRRRDRAVASEDSSRSPTVEMAARAACALLLRVCVAHVVQIGVDEHNSPLLITFEEASRHDLTMLAREKVAELGLKAGGGCRSAECIADYVRARGARATRHV